MAQPQAFWTLHSASQGHSGPLKEGRAGHSNVNTHGNCYMHYKDVRGLVTTEKGGDILCEILWTNGDLRS